MTSETPVPDDTQYALLVLQLSALGQRTDLRFTVDQQNTLVFLLREAADNVLRAKIIPVEEGDEQLAKAATDTDAPAGGTAADARHPDGGFTPHQRGTEDTQATPE